MERYINENKLSYDMMDLYRGMIDLSKQRDKIYRCLPAEELNETDYRRVDTSKLSIPEYGFVKHMVQFMNEIFDMDVEYNDMESVDYYNGQPKGNVTSIKPYLKKRD